MLWDETNQLIEGSLQRWVGIHKSCLEALCINELDAVILDLNQLAEFFSNGAQVFDIEVAVLDYVHDLFLAKLWYQRRKQLREGHLSIFVDV